MKLELSDEQRTVLEYAIEDQASDLDGRIRKASDRNEEYSVARLVRHREILFRLLADLRFPDPYEED